MKLIELTALAVRLIGIFLLLKLMGQFYYQFVQVQLFFGPNTDELSFLEFGAYAIGLLPLLAALWMIVFPVSVAKLLIPNTQSDSPAINMDGKLLQTTAFTVLGVYILSWAIPDLVHNLFQLRLHNEYELITNANPTETIYFLIVTLIEIGIGVYLTLGAVGLYNVLLKLRG